MINVTQKTRYKLDSSKRAYFLRNEIAALKIFSAANS